MDIRGNKGLFAYFRKYKSIIIDENSEIIKIVINILKKVNTANLSTTNTITMHILRKPWHRPSRSHETRKNKTKHNGKILFCVCEHKIKCLRKLSVCEHKIEK